MAPKKKINLALQGGGAHGAFTWGVLERLLEDEDLEICGISGTSAGALNGAALKSGMVAGGRRGAQENLAWLWGKVAGVADLGKTDWMAPFGVGAVSKTMELAMQFSMTDTMSQMVSPYSYGPLYRNPLADIVSRFNYDNVCNAVAPHLFICATRVRNGKIKIFQGSEISSDALMASACLPTMFQAVEMFDPSTGQTEAFWDGGYTGNPALFPLFADTLPDDIVIVNINPLERKELPRTPAQIQNRINEISFNSSLLRELRAIEFVQRLLADGKVSDGQMHRVRVHMIADDELMAQLSVATKSIPHAAVISKLHDAGYAAADTFLSKHRDAIGVQSSVDLPDMFG